MATVVDDVRAAAQLARVSQARAESAAVEALLDGAPQTVVAEALGVSQPAVSQLLRRRRERTLGGRWTIPVLAGYLKDRPELTMNETVRACSQFSSDFRALETNDDREIALGAPQLIGRVHLDALVAALADYEAHRAGLETPEWAISARYDVFPSWFAAPTAGLKGWVMRHTPPQFSVRGIFIDARDLESV